MVIIFCILGTAIVVIHFRKTKKESRKHKTWMLILHVVYRKSPSAHNYFNHSIPLLLAKTGTIYYVKYLYSEIAMHIISILSSESIA